MRTSCMVAGVIWGECRGKSLDEAIAIAWVIRNRVDTDLGNDGKPDWWGEGFAGVVLKKYQFSCLLPSDPNLSKILALDYWHPEKTPYLSNCINAANGVINNIYKDNTNGAVSYHATSMKTKPSWTKEMTESAVIGSHTFYKL